MPFCVTETVACTCPPDVSSRFLACLTDTTLTSHLSVQLPFICQFITNALGFNLQSNYKMCVLKLCKYVEPAVMMRGQDAVRGAKILWLKTFEHIWH